jgi:hypothetical protein
LSFGINLGYWRGTCIQDFPTMAQSQPVTSPPRQTDPRAVEILAKNIYREFRSGGFSEQDVVALAGELLALVTSEVRSQRTEPR